MKILHLVSSALCIIFGIIDIQYINKYQRVYSDYLFLDMDGTGSYLDHSYMMDDVTLEASLFSVFFLLFFVFAFILTIARLKRKTARIISIIGLSISVIFLVSCILPISSPGAISWDEFGPALIIYVLITFPFCIVNYIQSTRFISGTPNQQTVDDIV